MQWLTENWVLVLVIGGMAAMHLFGHGHRSGHSGGHGHSGDKRTTRDEVQDNHADTNNSSTRISGPSKDA